MKFNLCCRWWSSAVFLALPVLALTLKAQQSNSLVVSGQQGQAAVIQLQGRNYVEVEGLARLVSGTIGFNGNQIVLSISSTGRNTAVAPAAPPADSAPVPGFSNQFKTAGIEAMAEIREWHPALRTGIERGAPLNAEWLTTYRAQAQQAVRLASVAISTDSDKSVYPFVVNVFNNMKTLTDKYLQMTKDMSYIDPTSLQSDVVDQKIVTCTRSLASMATTNQFVDDGSCQ
ncbi:MAG: hypothetical protein WB607_11320 [Candidatus Acidiferrum sp.]|jgi:hypothetical protein